MTYVMVDVEADGPIPGDYSMVSFGAVIVDAGLKRSFYGRLKPVSERWVSEALAVSGHSREETLEFDDPAEVMQRFADWLKAEVKGRPMFISDNNGFDWQFVNWYFHHFLGANPFGHSSTNLGSLYKGMVGDMRKNFKHLRKTKHTHHPVGDAKGDAEAMLVVLETMNERFVLDDLLIFREQGLFPSRCISERDGIANGCYVFCPKFPYEPFVEISKELEKLNDYCLVQYKTVSSESQDSKEDLKYLNDDFFKEDYEFQAAKWGHNLAVTVKIVPILLICAFLEWALLKLLRQYVGQEKYPQVQRKSKIDSYLYYLEEASCYVSVPNDSSITLLQKIRGIRNDYAHGDIENVSMNLTEFKIGSAIKLVSTILMNCERNCIYK